MLAIHVEERRNARYAVYIKDHGPSWGDEIPKCTNCRGNHIPTSPEYPIIIKNLEVLKIMAHESVSYMDAHARVFGKKSPTQGYR